MWQRTELTDEGVDESACGLLQSRKLKGTAQSIAWTQNGVGDIWCKMRCALKDLPKSFAYKVGSDSCAAHPVDAPGDRVGPRGQ